MIVRLIDFGYDSTSPNVVFLLTETIMEVRMSYDENELALYSTWETMCVNDLSENHKCEYTGYIYGSPVLDAESSAFGGASGIPPISIDELSCVSEDGDLRCNFASYTGCAHSDQAKVICLNGRGSLVSRVKMKKKNLSLIQ